MENNRVIGALILDGKTMSAKVLKLMATEIVDAVEAFNLGRDLQSLYERQIETSQMGVSEEEILDAIRFAEKNLAK